MFFCLWKIQDELHHPIDKHSKGLIVDSIKMFLDYCTRFCDRQFITRDNVNKDILVRFETLLEDYFMNGRAEKIGLPTIQYLANELNMSANYLSDLLKKDIGHTALNYIHNKVIDVAKTQIVSTSKSISEIAYFVRFPISAAFHTAFQAGSRVFAK